MLLSDQQRDLWRQTALLGFVFGAITALAVIVVPLTGFDANYIQQARQEAAVEAALDISSGWDYVTITLISLIALPPFLLSSIFWLMIRRCLLPEGDILWRQISGTSATVAAVLGVVINVIPQYAELYAADPVQRAQVVRVWLLIIFYHNLMIYLTAFVIALRAYRWKTLPPAICYALFGVEIGLALFDIVLRNPDIPSSLILFGTIVGSIRMVLLATYMWVMSHQRQPDDSAKTVIPTR